jgi:hypothetical protein
LNEPDCITCLQDTADAYRVGREAAASQLLVQGIDRLAGILGALPPGDIARLQVHLAEALQAQQRRDFVRVADVLDYLLVPLCRRP